MAAVTSLPPTCCNAARATDSLNPIAATCSKACCETCVTALEDVAIRGSADHRAVKRPCATLVRLGCLQSTSALPAQLREIAALLKVQPGRLAAVIR
jgi:hypothetical protein